MKAKIILWITGLFIFIFPELFSQDIARQKALYVYNFAKEIEWPSDYRDGDFIIQVYGSSELFTELKSYTSSRTVLGQHITIKNADNSSDIEKCHMLFISREKSNEIQSIRKRVGNYKTLIITDKPEGILDGAGISLVSMFNRLNYEISTDNIIKMGLKYSSNLVDLAVDIPIAKH
jgi:YfiR/HmsC-like